MIVLASDTIFIDPILIVFYMYFDAVANYNFIWNLVNQFETVYLYVGRLVGRGFL